MGCGEVERLREKRGDFYEIKRSGEVGMTAGNLCEDFRTRFFGMAGDGGGRM